MKPVGKALAFIAGAVVLLATAAAAQAHEAGTEPGAPYTAQRRPRVAVLELDDTNRDASNKGYAASVESMLVTALQSRTQFAVAERQKLGGLLEEKRRIQRGMVDVPPGDTSSLKLLEKLDAYVHGTVTLLDNSRIEIDTRLFSGFDGQVAATARGSGPEACLRPIVERLAAELEEDFLHSDYGTVEVRLKAPENVRIFLTPLPLGTASGAEKAPVERSSTIVLGGEYATVETWMTDPTSATIEKLLPGWYSLRLARPGYEDLKVDPARFAVHVEPQTTKVVDLDALGFVLRKKRGSLALRVKRQYLDKDYTRVPRRAILMGGKGLDLNRFEAPKEPGDDSQCDLLREQPPLLPDYGRTYVATGQKFDYVAFQGGELIIEDYQGEIVPAGQYQLALWESGYRVKKIEVTVSHGELRKAAKATLARDTLTLKLEATGAQPGSRVILVGRETRHRLELPLDFTGVKQQRGLPADTYKVSTNVSGLDGWKQTVDLPPGSVVTPGYYTRSPAYDPWVTSTSEDGKKPPSPHLIVKTRLALAGRLEILSRLPEPSANTFLDEEVGKILDRLLHEKKPQPGGVQDHRQHLARCLEVIDLLVLGPRDMARLRRSPEDAAIVESYVRRGGALFAFVTEPGDYRAVAGAPLVIESTGRPTNDFALSLGDVAGMLPWLERKAEAPAKRVLPELVRYHTSFWRVLAFTRGRESPRIVERGRKEDGGYVAFWLDDPASFRDRKGKTVPQVEETRAKVEEFVFKWARYLMYRRYDKSGKLRREAEEELEGGW